MSSPKSRLTASRIFFANGQGYSIGMPLAMQEAKAMVFAPRFTISLARKTAFLPGQPPQSLKPINSISSSIPSKAPFFSRTILKSVVPGHMSRVCLQRITPSFIILCPSAGAPIRPPPPAAGSPKEKYRRFFVLFPISLPARKAARAAFFCLQKTVRQPQTAQPQTKAGTRCVHPKAL